MKSNNSVRLSGLFAAGLFAVASVVAADSGLSPISVKVGMANALTGSAAALGTGVTAGATAYFEKLNAAGGVHGRKVHLVSVDDGYEPERCVAQTKQLIETERVFSLLGYVGTPTATAIMPLLGQNPDLVFFGPYTGAEFLRNPVKRNVFNVRASYFDETETMVERLTKDLGIEDIGVFVQDDAFGSAGEAGVQKALRKRNLTLAGKGTYKRNTVDVAAGVAALRKTAPKAVVFVGTYKAGAAFIRQCHSEGYRPTFIVISFVGTAALAQELGADGDGVFITQVMPSPWDDSEPLVKSYQEAMRAIGQTDFDYTSLEGYTAAAAYTLGLEKAGPALTRAGLIAALETLQTSVGGFPVAFAPTDRQASDKVYLTVLRGGRAVPVASLKP